MAHEKFSWLNFLNESCTWQTKAQAEQFFSTISGTAVKLTPTEISLLSNLESYMRDQLAAIHFDRKLDFEYLNKRLSKIHLQLREKKSTARHSSFPSLSPQSDIKTKPLQQILDSVIFQFAYFLGETVDGETPYTVERCEALYRKQNLQESTNFYKKFRSLENSWREEVLDDSPIALEFERCADFFISSAGTKSTKFCSDICRFNSFAVRKEIEVPGYQAEKQRRYRERQKTKS
jgi:hypothetical protein